jgi:cytochrome bd-type quinol oxidase subunit 2
MTMQESRIIQFFLGLIFLAVLLIQVVVVPGSATNYANSYPEVAYLAQPYVTAVVIAFAGIQIALLAAWRLVAIAVTDRTWADRQAKWTNILVGALLVMAAVLAGVFIHAGSVESVGGPPMLFGIIGCAAIGAITIALRRWVKAWFQDDARVLEFH